MFLVSCQRVSQRQGCVLLPRRNAPQHASRQFSVPVLFAVGHQRKINSNLSRGRISSAAIGQEGGEGQGGLRDTSLPQLSPSPAGGGASGGFSWMLILKKLQVEAVDGALRLCSSANKPPTQSGGLWLDSKSEHLAETQGCCRAAAA